MNLHPPPRRPIPVAGVPRTNCRETRWTAFLRGASPPGGRYRNLESGIQPPATRDPAAGHYMGENVASQGQADARDGPPLCPPPNPRAPASVPGIATPRLRALESGLEVIRHGNATVKACGLVKMHANPRRGPCTRWRPREPYHHPVTGQRPDLSPGLKGRAVHNAPPTGSTTSMRNRCPPKPQLLTITV
jgi:hypothetical protein